MRGYGSAGTSVEGSPGTNGKTVRNGSGVPDNGAGADGDFYIDTDTYDIYGPKTTGDWGSSTSLVSTVVGPDGTSIRSGSGAPGSGDGNDGDFYIDTDVSDLYGPKATTWPSPVSLIGATGSNGSDGSDGANGSVISSGSGAPDNVDGNDGDFYFDAAGVAFYGPKTMGAWGSAVLVDGEHIEAGSQNDQSGATKRVKVYATSTDATPVTVDTGYAPPTDAIAHIEGDISAVNRAGSVGRLKDIYAGIKQFSSTVAMLGESITGNSIGDTSLANITVDLTVVDGTLNVTFSPPLLYSGSIDWLCDLTIIEN